MSLVVEVILEPRGPATTTIPVADITVRRVVDRTLDSTAEEPRMNECSTALGVFLVLGMVVVWGRSVSPLVQSGSVDTGWVPPPAEESSIFVAILVIGFRAKMKPQ